MKDKYSTTKHDDMMIALSLPTRYIIDRVLGGVIAQARVARGEGRGPAGSSTHNIFPSSVENYKRDCTPSHRSPYSITSYNNITPYSNIYNIGDYNASKVR